MKSSIVITIFISLCDISFSYKVGELITCFENNKIEPGGYTDPIYSDESSDTCQLDPDLCSAYINDEPFRRTGDVCDHTDPRSGLVRDMCYFNVIFGSSEDDADKDCEDPDEETCFKGWSWKCWETSQCPLRDEYGSGIPGCVVFDKRISCCCNDYDMCNGNELFQQYAQYGLVENYPPDFDEIMALDTGDIVVVRQMDVSGSGNSNKPDISDDDSVDEDSIDEDSIDEAIAFSEFTKNDITTNGINIVDLLLIFTFFIIGLLCLGIGLFIGSKLSNQAEDVIGRKDIDL